MPVHNIVEQLRSEEARLMKECEQLKLQTTQTSEELKRVRTALSALGPKKQGSGRKSTKQAATKLDVMAAIAETLEQRSPINEEELKGIVQQAIVEAGKSLQGFALRFAEAIKDERFTQDADGYHPSHLASS